MLNWFAERVAAKMLQEKRGAQKAEQPQAVEPAQAVPVRDSYLDQCLEQRMAAMESVAPLDSDTRQMVLELCRLTILNGAVDGIITAAMEEMAAKIKERLEAGE